MSENDDRLVQQSPVIEVEPTLLGDRRRYRNLREMTSRAEPDMERMVRGIQKIIDDGQMAVTDEGIVVEWEVRVRVVAYAPPEEFDDESRERFHRMTLKRREPVIVNLQDHEEEAMPGLREHLRGATPYPEKAEEPQSED